MVTGGGGRGSGNYCLRGQSFSLGGCDSSQGGWQGWLNNAVNALNITDVYFYKWLKW